MYNPSLRQQPRHHNAPVIPLKQGDSLLEWLEKSGRLIAREVSDPDYLSDEPDLTDLMTVEEDNDYDLEDDFEDAVE